MAKAKPEAKKAEPKAKVEAKVSVETLTRSVVGVYPSTDTQGNGFLNVRFNDGTEEQYAADDPKAAEFIAE